MITRLQLGASRLEELAPQSLRVFLDKRWMHLGEPEPDQHSKGLSLSRLRAAMRVHSSAYILRVGLRKALRRSAPRADADSLYGQTNFQAFFYRNGDPLPFPDGSVHFVYSEHFFEHLFFDEAVALLAECRRVLTRGGVVRTVVPDADLRTYEAPEPVGFPDRKMPFSNASKHKTRWSVYLLTEAVRAAGLDPVPLRYCDRAGQYVQRDPASVDGIYGHCPDQEMVRDLSYVFRIDSLIVDGVKGVTATETREDRSGG